MTAPPFQYSAVMALGRLAPRCPRAGRDGCRARPRRPRRRTATSSSWVELQFADGTWRTLEPTRYAGVALLVEGTEPTTPARTLGFVQEQLERDEDIKIPRDADIELARTRPERVRSVRGRWPSWVRWPRCRASSASPRCCWCRCPLLKMLRRAPPSPYVVVVGRCTSTAGRRCSTRPATAARRSRTAGAASAQASELGVGPDLARAADAAVFAPVAASAGEGPRTSGTRASSCGARLAGRGRRGASRVWASLQPRLALAGWARRRSDVAQVPSRCATKIAVPGVSSPRVRDQPPHTRSCCSGHSGSTRSTSLKPWRGEQPHPVAERAVVLDVGHHAAGVVDLDVGRAVPVGLRRGEPGLARVVGEHPARRVGDREGEPPARAQHPGDLGDRAVDVADELQGAEGAEDDVEAARRRRAGAVAVPRTDGTATPVSSSRRSECCSWRWDRSSPKPRPPCVRTQREHWPAPLPTSSTSRPRHVTEDRQLVLGVALGAPHEAGVAEERAVRGLVLVGVAVPVGPVGLPRLLLGDGAALDPHGLRQVILHARSVVPVPGAVPRGTIAAMSDLARVAAAAGRWPLGADVPRGGRRRACRRTALPAR